MAPVSARVAARRLSRRSGSVAVVAALCTGVLAGWACRVPGLLFSTSPTLHSGASRASPGTSRSQRLPRHVAGGDAAVADPKLENLESPTVQKEPVYEDGQGQIASAAEGAAGEPLFTELNISAKTDPKKLMGAIVGCFNNDQRAVDLVLIDPRFKASLVRAIALIPEAFQASAQVLVRRRDRRLRVRVVKQFRPLEDEDPQVFRVSKEANINGLGNRLMGAFVDPTGNNLARTVRLQFLGMEATANAILAMEIAGKNAYRELVFHARYVEQEQEPIVDDSGDEAGDAPVEPKKVVFLEVTFNTA